MKPKYKQSGATRQRKSDRLSYHLTMVFERFKGEPFAQKVPVYSKQIMWAQEALWVHNWMLSTALPWHITCIATGLDDTGEIKREIVEFTVWQPSLLEELTPLINEKLREARDGINPNHLIAERCEYRRARRSDHIKDVA
ncbi:hypothetical protein [Larsenimonas suaedae]|uniref:Uncharacterized protein n=1 Tax=Larsenimonas suaedae TaxID=1851019 RepID=A0ABU1GZ31_9GAMM|nr:hypothetical protein [Larsenimonas suaedae]MCM2973780.1 hypothetical protein [Larsenimonas suaedae]MDR5897304.1 hypothetical protein [Larsenimonas suaedae]